MKRYHDLTNAEKLALTQEQFETAVKLEAVERGIKLPITLDNIIKQHGFNGYTIPGDSVFFYEVVVPGQYNGHEERTGLAFKTIEAARAVIEGAIALYEDGYGVEKQSRIAAGEISVREVAVSLTKPKTLACYVVETGQDDSDYETLCEECVKNLSALRQAEYDREVISRKLSQYMELAKGDIEIAKAFWAKTERTDFPSE